MSIDDGTSSTQSTSRRGSINSVSSPGTVRRFPAASQRRNSNVSTASSMSLSSRRASLVESGLLRLDNIEPLRDPAAEYTVEEGLECLNLSSKPLDKSEAVYIVRPCYHKCMCKGFEMEYPHELSEHDVHLEQWQNFIMTVNQELDKTLKGVTVCPVLTRERYHHSKHEQTLKATIHGHHQKCQEWIMDVIREHNLNYFYQRGVEFALFGVNDDNPCLGLLA
eukprot:Clim_evm2s213 gene=Clim_evmTU2s213